MKIAILISGEPRFCREFDIFLERLTGADEVHWYFVLWSKSPRQVFYFRQSDNGQGSTIVSEPWCDITEDWARKEFERLLPKGHIVSKVEVLDQETINFDHNVKSDGETNISNVWKMYWGTNRAFKHLEDSGIQYDLVIKSRSDLETLETLDISRFAGIPDGALAMSNNCKAGYGVFINDFIAIGKQSTMKIYADCINWIPEYLKAGNIFHPETILAHYLSHKGLNLINGGYNVAIRVRGNRINHHLYHSDFGRWV